MIQIYADGALVYDSRLDEYDLHGLKVTRGLNKGGTAEIVMPAGHPAYSSFTGYRTIVEIYRDGVLRFRGRALYPVDDYDNTRTLVCEGELCFLQDGVSRPYLYQDTPLRIFAAVLGEYNAQVESFKQFKLGTVDVTDPNDYVRLESEEAESVLDTINKLTERCGGYVVFTTNDAGARTINWLASVGSANQQIIEAGENLFDFNRSGANTDLATAIIPYGAKDESTGERVTIKSVNAGKDYIKDETAAALRGTIMRAVTWDDVTEPQNLLTKARQYLNECKLYVNSLSISALDLSYVDKSIESFKVGDLIRVVSSAHGVDEDFQLIESTEDLLNPAGSFVTLGKEVRTLTGLDVAGDNKSKRELQKAVSTVKTEIKVGDQQSATAMEEKVTKQIAQSATNTLVEVGKLYATKDALKECKGTVDDIALEITQLRDRIAALEGS